MSLMTLIPKLEGLSVLWVWGLIKESFRILKGMGTEIKGCEGN